MVPSPPSPARLDPGASGALGAVLIVLRYAWLVAALAFTVAAVVAVKGLRGGRVYAAESVFILDAERQSAGMSGIAAQFGIAIPQAGGDAQSPEFYVNLLRSRAILRRVVDSAVTVPTPRGPIPLQLIDSIPAVSDRALRREFAIQRLANRIGAVAAPRTGVVTLRVQDPSPYAALALNRRLLDLLREFNLARRRGRATAERAFIQDRLVYARDSLTRAEERLRTFMAGNREYATFSEASFQRQRIERDVSTRSQVYLSLLQSFEQAKLEEFREAPLIAVIQPPELPVAPEARRLARKTIVGFVIGAVLGVFLSYLLEMLRRLRQRPPEASQALRQALVDARRNFFRPWRAFGRRPRPD